MTGPAKKNYRNRIKNWGLYVITDENLSKGRSHLKIAEAAIAGGADVIQLRDKTASGRDLFETGMKMRRLTRKSNIPFIMNDRLDIALAIKADGVHLGQSDLPGEIAAKLLRPHHILGVSATSVSEALQAEKNGADYLGVGPIFEARKSKSDAGEPLGLDLIKKIRRECTLPIIAIGGIEAANINDVIRAGATGVAVISAIVASEDIQYTTARLKNLVEQARKEDE